LARKEKPEHLVELLTQPDALRTPILEHIAEEAGAFRGQLVEWHVVNEPYTEFDMQTALTGVSRDAAPDYIERHASTLVPSTVPRAKPTRAQSSTSTTTAAGGKDRYDEALQADYTRDFLTAMFAHEGVIGVLTWVDSQCCILPRRLEPASGGQAWLDLGAKRMAHG
jgi:hypothetical protein